MSIYDLTNKTSRALREPAAKEQKEALRRIGVATAIPLDTGLFIIQVKGSWQRNRTFDCLISLTPNGHKTVIQEATREDLQEIAEACNAAIYSLDKAYSLVENEGLAGHAENPPAPEPTENSAGDAA